MKRQAIRIFSRDSFNAVQTAANKFLELISPEDVVSITNTQVDHDMRGAGLRSQDFYIVYTITIVYTYDYTQTKIEAEINALNATIAKLVNDADSTSDYIYLGEYERVLPVKLVWGASKVDVIKNVFESEEYKTLRQEIVDKWYAKDTDYNNTTVAEEY
ncbi:hypothetical protein [Fibrobacter sp.]|uniref:hypothetical protein n=1 Tax=Fibrobacter sp. TaxID=35828 RepID=UPI00386EBC7A